MNAFMALVSALVLMAATALSSAFLLKSHYEGISTNAEAPLSSYASSTLSNQHVVVTGAAPVIATVSPEDGPVGTRIMIKGTGFTPTGNDIYFTTESGAVNVTSPRGTTLEFTIPAGVSCIEALKHALCGQYIMGVTPGLYEIYIVNQNGRSNSATFQVTP